MAVNFTFRTAAPPEPWAVNFAFGGVDVVQLSGTSAGTSLDGVSDTIVNIVGTAVSPGTSEDTGAIVARTRTVGASAGTSSDAAAARLRLRIAGGSHGTSTDTAYIGEVVSVELAGASPGTSLDFGTARLRLRIAGSSAGTSLDTTTLAPPAPPLITITRALRFTRFILRILRF